MNQRTTSDRPSAPARVVVRDGDLDGALKRLAPSLQSSRAAVRRRTAFISPGERRRQAVRDSIRRLNERAAQARKRGW